MSFVRIIILNYNSSNYTLDVLKMLSKQHYIDYEIVVVDNDSKKSDQQNLIDNIPENIHLLISHNNLGYSGGNNIGLKFQGSRKIDYHLVLNNDLIIEDPFFISKMVDAFELEENKNVVAQSPLVDTVQTLKPIEFQIQVRKLLSPLKLYILSFALLNRIFSNYFRDFIYSEKMPFLNKQFHCDTINGAAFLIKDDFIRMNNYLDEYVFLFHEEMILGKQIQSAGFTCLLNGKVTVKHLQGVSTDSNKANFNIKMERFKYKSEAYFFFKYLNINRFFVRLFCLLKEIEIWVKKLIYQFK